MTNALQFTEQDRIVPPGQPAHPRREVWRLMRSNELALQAEREASAKELVSVSQRHASFLTAMATAYHELRTFVAQNGQTLGEAGLSRIADMAAGVEAKFGVALRKGGVEVIDAEGIEQSDEAVGWVDVLDAVPTDGIDHPTFGAVVKPAIRLDGELVQRAVAPLLVPLHPLQPSDDSEEPPS